MKNVLITGATKGIGKEIAVLLSKDYNVFITGRNGKELKNIVETTQIQDFFAIDLTDTNACQKLFEKFGNIDILVNNAGDYIYKEIDKYNEDEIEYLFKINAQIPFYLTTLYSKQMKEKRWGRIVNIGSISAVIGEAGAALYSSTKASLMGLSRAVGLELAEYGITVNTIHPGWVDTQLANTSIEDCEFSKEEILQTIPQKRFITPAEIANLVKYLISDNAKGLTGQNINLCAGLTIG